MLGCMLIENDRIWFVTDGVQPNDPDNTVERWLAVAPSRRPMTGTGTCACSSTPRPCVPERPRGAQDQRTALLGRRRRRITITSVRTPSVAVAGKPIPIELQYRLEAPTDQGPAGLCQLLSGQNIPLAGSTTGRTTTTPPSAACPRELSPGASLLVPRNTPEGEYLAHRRPLTRTTKARLITIDGPDFCFAGSGAWSSRSRRDRDSFVTSQPPPARSARSRHDRCDQRGSSLHYIGLAAIFSRADRAGPAHLPRRRLYAPFPAIQPLPAR